MRTAWYDNASDQELKESREKYMERIKQSDYAIYWNLRKVEEIDHELEYRHGLEMKNDLYVSRGLVLV